MNDILRNVFAVIFYALFFTWLFLKIRNVVIVNKLKCKEKFKEIKRNFESKKFEKFNIVMIIIWFIIIMYLLGALAVGGVVLFLGFITLGGAAFVDTGADPTLYNYIIAGCGIYLTGMKFLVCIMYLFYIHIFGILINGIYINTKSYKELKDEK